MITQHDQNLLDILIKIKDSLKNIYLEKNINLDDITKKYKDAIFEVGEKKDCGPNIISSNLQNNALYEFYQNHACCWVNYVGCDSFSDKVKRQVFFSSILMEDEDEEKNKELLEVNEKIFKTYNEMLNERIPIDLWVQVFFQDHKNLEVFLKNKHISGNDRFEILSTLSNIQEKGLVIPMRTNAVILNNDIKTLLYDQTIVPVTSSTIKELEVNKDEIDSREDEIISLIESICHHHENSTSLAKKVFRLNKSLHHNVQFVYFLPAEGANGAVGLIIYGAKRELSAIELADLKLHGYNILFPYVSAYKSAWENQMLINESIKSAISAIMSRNMSHNLGSHCMHYTKTALEDLANKINGHGPEIRGAAKLIGYIQGRMDFLATLVSGEMYSYGNVNFKSQLLDILTVDDFSKRHFKKSSEWEKYTVIKKNQVRQSMQTLSKQLRTIIDEENENNPIEQKKVVDATNILINDLSSLIIDNAELRTTNFLLENLIKSEHFYRNDIFGEQKNNKNPKDRPFFLHVRYNGNLFTGAEDLINEESSIKNQISQINVAMPGGVMSTHAFFNIIENLIRNSAKHRAEDLQKDSLTTTIDIRSIKKDQEPYLRFTIYDNKHNAGIVYPIIVNQLKTLRILDENNSLDKKSKGLKEMLVTTLWLRANEFETNYSDLISKIEKETEGDKKINLIKQYAFEIVKVDDNGNQSNAEKSNLGLTFVLPCYETSMSLNLSNNNQVLSLSDLIRKIKDEKFRADIVDVNDTTFLDSVRSYFTRVYNNTDSSLTLPKQIQYRIANSVCEKNGGRVREDTLKLYAVMRRRFGKKLPNYRIVFGSTDPNASIVETSNPSNIIYFQRHLNKRPDFKRTKIFLYADSISGGNFTVTLMENFENGQTSDNKFKTWIDKYFELKIIESALTRITLIDERLSDSYNAFELMMKNIRVLNLNPNSKNEARCWTGNKFKDNRNYTHFLSIHLGLIEKMINNENNWFYQYYNETFKDVKEKPDKAKVFMDYLRRKFGSGKEIFISVHSGRGNYSYDLEHSLSEYPFINLSAIESVFSNSKYMLAQLFYNTIYIGKGDYNKK